MNTQTIEQSLVDITTKLNVIISLLERQTPKNTKDILLEALSTTSNYGTIGSDLPTAWNTSSSMAYATDMLPTITPPSVSDDYLYNATVDPDTINADTSIFSVR